MSRVYSVLILLIFAQLGLYGQNPIVFDGEPQKNIGLHFEYFEDASGELTLQEIKDSTFQKVETEILNLGTSDASFWLHCTVVNESHQNEFLIEFMSPIMDEIIGYQSLEDDNPLIIGQAHNFSERPIDSPNFIFPIDLEQGGKRDLYFKVRCGKQIILPVSLSNLSSSIEEQRTKDLFYAMYAGIILVMFLYNLFVYFTVKDKNYLYYIAFIFGVGITQLILNGYGDQFFWPNNRWLAIRSVNFSGILSGITSLLFTQVFIHTKQYTPTMHKVFTGFIVVYLISFVFTLLGYYTIGYNIINLVATSGFLLIWAAWKAYRKKYRPAMYFIIAFSIFLLGVTIFVMKDVGVLPYNNFTIYALPLGSAIELILLSFALADRINVFKRDKEESQRKVIEAVKENEKIVREQNVMLEKKVHERTAELEESYSDLNQAMTDLKQTQSQLVDAEKMASLGQMTAGIAHELNNPINFVSSNISPLKKDIDDVFEVLDKYGEINSESDLKAFIEEIDELKEDIELDYVRKEIEELMVGITDGAKRTADIVLGLRVFSRLDEDALKKAGMNECLNATLVILKSNLKEYNCTIEKEFDEDIPEINCLPGKLNQVFMNIINNSAQATSYTDKPESDRKVIVKSFQDDANVYISIKDNGIGMDDETKGKIFDPFFTTKQVGEGTGLGLSIVLGIIQNHKGDIEVKSEIGVGTEFIITLPKNL